MTSIQSTLLKGAYRIFRLFSSSHPPTHTTVHPRELVLFSRNFNRSIQTSRPIIQASTIGQNSPREVTSSSVVSSLISGGRVVRTRVATMSTGAGDTSDALVVFSLSPSSALKIQKGDVTKWSIDGSSDAIVNPANERMLGGGGADGAIHRAAGPELKEACYKVSEVKPGVRCPTGEARITPGFKLPASHVIHTVGPIYETDPNPEASLSNAYRNSLRVAKENNIQYVAFTAISCGVYGYPYDEAATIAISTAKEFADQLKEVHFVLFSDEVYDVWVKKAKELLQE